MNLRSKITYLTILVVLNLVNFTLGQEPESSELMESILEGNKQDQPTQGQVPSVTDLITIVDKATGEGSESQEWSTPVKLVIIFAGLAILPSLMVMMTSFTRIVIVLAFVRRALTTQTIPPTIAIMGLALFLTLYTMAPTFSQINTKAIQPYLADEMDFS
ncbi:MAG: hypothetical protein ACYSRQ_06995, partial [Planctomycetota bacterium]